jgi:hypothetical protein
VLLKPDPQTPVSGGVLFAQLFEQAGLPEGLLHVLSGGIPTAEAIVADPSVDPQGQICLTCRCPKLSPRGPRQHAFMRTRPGRGRRMRVRGRSTRSGGR